MILGAHCSAAGGVHCACLEAQIIGAEALQLFTSNQRTWISRSPFLQKELIFWEQTKNECGINCVISHASYLINLGSEHEEVIRKSRIALKDEILRCQALDIDFLVLHPGSSGKQDTETCLLKVVEGLLSLQKELLFSQKKPLLSLESMAGQGSQIGKTFDELSFLIDRLSPHLPVAVCLDTCHLFASGQDIRASKGMESMLNAFDKKIGLSHLGLFHLNDSLKDLGSRVDRHASLGKGYIGWESFEWLMREKTMSHVPKILETPDGPNSWKKELRHLKEVKYGSRTSDIGNAMLE